MNKKLGLVLLATGLVCGQVAPTYAATVQLVYDGKTHNYDLPPISLYINGEKIETTVMDPVSIDGRVLVPAREVFEPMGAQVNWVSEEKKVYITYKNQEMVLTVNEKEVLLDGESVYLDVPAKVINEKIMIPIRFISETLGFDVDWNQRAYRVSISEAGVSIPPIVEENPKEEVTEDVKEEVTEDIKDELEEEVTEDEERSDEIIEDAPITGSVSGQIYIGSENKHQLNVGSGNYAQTKVQSVQIAQNVGEATATIKASSKISKAIISVQEGKVIVDIENSQSGLGQSIVPNENTYVKLMRSSQFTSTTTRVVFDLKSGALVKASLSEDKSRLILTMKQQSIEGIEVAKEGNQDYLFFKGLGESQMSLSQNEVEGKINFTIANSGIGQAIHWEDLNTNYIDEVSVEAYENGVKGTITLKATCETSLTSDLKGTTLWVKEKQETDLDYTGGSRPTFELSSEMGLRKSDIKVTDNYRSKQLILDLGGDYSEYLPTGIQEINDGKLTKVEVTNYGTTKLILNTASVYAVNLYEEEGKVQVELVKPNEKYSQIVVVDTGHGGSDSGAVANGLKEKEVNDKHAKALYALLEADPNIKVYMTREEDVYPSLQNRTELANDIGADLFVSVHNNSASASAVGTETLYYPSEMSKKVAQLVQDKLIAYTGLNNRGIKSRADLYVLRTSEMPAILIEGGFLTNASEANYINSTTYCNLYAQAVYEAIVECFKFL